MDRWQDELRSDGGTPGEIENRIRLTRHEMDETLDELGRRLNPRNVFEDVLAIFQGDRTSGARAREVAERVGRSLRDNPVPAALIGAGVAWLLFRSTADREEGVAFDEYHGATFGGVQGSSYGTGVGSDGSPAPAMGSDDSGVLGRAKEKASHGVRRAKEAAGSAAAAAAHGVGAAGARIRSGGAAARRKSVETYEESPLAAGLGALAAGVLCGLLMPGTRREDEWMGERSDELKEEARELGREVMERGKDVAAQAAETARQAAEEHIDEAAREHGASASASPPAAGERGS